jgi:hypothetical protein
MFKKRNKSKNIFIFFKKTVFLRVFKSKKRAKTKKVSPVGEHLLSFNFAQDALGFISLSPFSLRTLTFRFYDLC